MDDKYFVKLDSNTKAIDIQGYPLSLCKLFYVT